MPEVEETDEIIMGFVRYAMRRPLPVSDEEIESMIDDYMRSLVAGG